MEVAGLLKEASDQLEIGETLQTDDFDLFQVMSAVEIGDPRLDAGMQENQPETTGRQLDVPCDLSEAQIIAVMDKLSLMEATWHSCCAIAQTVYTCYYMLHQDRIKHLLTLSAYCTAVKVAAQLVHDLIHQAGPNEEDDFIAYMFAFQDSLGLADVPKAVAQLTTAEEHLTALSQAKRKESHLQTAMLLRLRFKRNLLNAFSRLSKNTKQDMEAARKLLTQAKVDLEKLHSSNSASEVEAPGFLPKINVHRMGPAPPRPVKLLDSNGAQRHWERLVKELLHVCDVVKISSWPALKAFLHAFSQKGFGPIPRAFVAASLAPTELDPSKPWTPSAPVMRAAMGLPKQGTAESLQLNGFVDECTTWAKAWVRCMCLNKTRQRRRHRRSVEDWQKLLDHALQVEQGQQFQSWLASSDWQWRPAADSRLHPQGPLSTWVEMECSTQLLQHLLLGFELECYLPFEYSTLYWYCDYLYGIMVEDANYLSVAFPKVSLGKGTKGRAAKRSPNKGEEKVSDPEAVNLWQKGALGSVEKHMCQGLMRSAAALYLAGLVKPRPNPFNTEEQYFEQRFFVFTQVAAPAALSYEDYSQVMSLRDCKAVELMRNAALNFHEVRSHAAALMKPQHSWLPAAVEQFQKLENIAKRNIVALAILTQAEAQKDPVSQQASGEKNDSLDQGSQPAKGTDAKIAANGKEQLKPAEANQWKVDWDFSHHKFFPVITLAKK